MVRQFWRKIGIYDWRGAAAALFLCVTLPLAAAASSTARGFVSNDSKLIIGMAASLSLEQKEGQEVVEQATRDNKDKFVGIVTTKEANVISYGSPSSNVYVTTQGEAIALVTDLNGVVKKGDRLTISPLDGITMKADSSETHIIGLALADFSESGAKTQPIEGGTSAKINTLKIEVVASTAQSAQNGSEPFLVLFGKSITGKPVSQWQVGAALIILFLVLVVEGSIIYGAVHSSIQAIGRNPLTSSAVKSQFLRVTGVSIVVLLFGGAAIYAILWS